MRGITHTDLLYFLHYFGINSLKELPLPKEFKEHEFTAGEESDFSEN